MLANQDFDFFIQWHLTERCNLSCRHCYQSGRGMSELSLAEIREVIAEVAEMLQEWETAHGLHFSPSFNITGGEPLLRADLLDVLTEIGSHGFAMYLLTNGTLIDFETAELIAGRGIRGVQVSMEGPIEIHDAIRGSGSFAASCVGIRNVLAAGMKVTLNFTLSRANADQMLSMIPLAMELGVQRLGFSRFVPTGQGRELMGELLPPHEVKELYERLLSQSVPGLEIITGDPLATQMQVAADSPSGCTPFAGCAAGLSGLTLLADGTIVPCRRLELPIGNVRTDSLREVWATSELLGRLRDKSNYTGKCGSCERWAACRGCRAIAFAHAQGKGCNNLLAEDPQCFIDS